MNEQKIIKGAAGAIVLSTGVIFKLSELNLSASEVVLCGAKNLENEFVKAPNLHIADSFLNGAKQGAKKLSQRLLKKARELF